MASFWRVQISKVCILEPKRYKSVPLQWQLLYLFFWECSLILSLTRVSFSHQHGHRSSRKPWSQSHARFRRGPRFQSRVASACVPEHRPGESTDVTSLSQKPSLVTLIWFQSNQTSVTCLTHICTLIFLSTSLDGDCKYTVIDFLYLCYIDGCYGYVRLSN